MAEQTIAKLTAALQQQQYKAQLTPRSPLSPSAGQSRTTAHSVGGPFAMTPPRTIVPMDHPQVHTSSVGSGAGNNVGSTRPYRARSHSATRGSFGSSGGNAQKQDKKQAPRASPSNPVGMRRRRSGSENNIDSGAFFHQHATADAVGPYGLSPSSQLRARLEQSQGRSEILDHDSSFPYHLYSFVQPSPSPPPPT